MSKEFYITSQGGCISTKGFFKDNLTTKDGNIVVWEDEASASRAIETVRWTWENDLADKKRAVKAPDQDSFITDRIDPGPLAEHCFQLMLIRQRYRWRALGFPWAPA